MHNLPKRWLVVLEAIPHIQGYMGSSNWGSACVQQGANQRRKILIVNYIRMKYFCTVSLYKNFRELRYTISYYIYHTTLYLATCRC